MLCNGPPLFPGLMAASVWMRSSKLKFIRELLSPIGTSRCRPEMMPELTVCVCPYGLPIAITGSPIIRSELLPIGSVRNLRPPGLRILRSARSSSATNETMPAS